jgi:DNA-binding beta-propeller fold protein YncE
MLYQLKKATSLCAFFFLILTSKAQSGYQFKQKITLQGNGKWDYITTDEKSNRLFVSHFDRVHVVDLTSNKEIKSINNLNGVHGIALAADFNKGFISNGKDNTVTVFNYSSLDSITTIKLGGEKADAIIYDAFTKTVWVFCGKSNNASVIDVASNKLLQQIAIGKAPEFAVTDNKGFIYNNLEEEDGIAVINATTRKVERIISLEKGAAPTGLAIDILNGILFSACAETQKLAVVEIVSGKVIASLPITNKVDAVTYDPITKLIFCSGGDGFTTVIKQTSKDKYEVLEKLSTQAGAKTMALNTLTHKLYFTTAEFAGKEMKPNSFVVLVYRKG